MLETTLMESGFPTPLVSTEWLAGHLHDPDIRILDCSTTIQFDQQGKIVPAGCKEDWEIAHIPESQYIDVIGQLSDPEHAVPVMMLPVVDFSNVMAGYGISNGNRVILYDSCNNVWAARVWWMLRVCGFDDAAVLNGGWTKWIKENRETSTEKNSYPRGDFVPSPRLELMYSKEQVLNAIDDKRISIIDALSPEKYRGEVSTVPDRPGHIPGSRNVFYENLLDPDTKTYRDVDEIRKLFEKTGALESDRVVTYCGGGVSACSDALALTLIGVENVSVYDGSMSEWKADPELPLETG